MNDFLDKLKNGINKGANVISVRSKEMLESTKVKGEIGAIAQKKRTALRELGELVYGMYLQNNQDDTPKINEKCEQIKILDQQVLEKETELKKVHVEAELSLNENACKACGAENSDNAKFCIECGQKLD